jgi:hypothetical protein
MLGLFTVTLVAGSFTSPASAQTPPPLSCEQRAAILDQLVGDLSTSRRNAEIETAALRVQVKALSDQIDAMKKVPEKPITEKNTK